MNRALTIALAVLLMVIIATPYVSAVTIPAGGFSSIAGTVLSATSNTAIFILPSTTGASPRCTSLTALFTDWVAEGIVFGLTANPQLETTDANTGSPLLLTSAPNCGSGTTSKPLLPFGGPLVNNIVHYYEQVLADSPVFFSQSGGSDKFIKRSDLSTIASLLFGSVGGSTDFFVLEAFIDPSGNTIYIFYGFAFLGTSAAAHKMLNFIQTATLSGVTSAWQVWSWFDANGDGIVNLPPTDTYTLIGSG